MATNPMLICHGNHICLLVSSYVWVGRETGTHVIPVLESPAWLLCILIALLAKINHVSKKHGVNMLGMLLSTC